MISKVYNSRIRLTQVALQVDLIIFFASVGYSTKGQILQVGAAEVKITPPVGSIIGNSYGIMVADGIEDHLYSKALVIEKKGKKTAFVACDLISLPHKLAMRTRELLEHQTDISGSNLLMTATHAHAGLQLNPLFWDAVGREIMVESVVEILNDLK